MDHLRQRPPPGSDVGSISVSAVADSNGTDRLLVSRDAERGTQPARMLPGAHFASFRLSAMPSTLRIRRPARNVASTPLHTRVFLRARPRLEDAAARSWRCC